MSKLPHDVLQEILKRLPVGSLLRCRCVCRSWRSAVDDPRFVALHLSHSALDASRWYLVCIDGYELVCIDGYDPIQRLCTLFPTESISLPSQSQIEMPFFTPVNCYGFVGSCNGLICITEISEIGYGQSMYLWNLFTRKYKAVRRSRPEYKFLAGETAHVALGFGFDARSNDYKIVRIIYFPDDNGWLFGHRVEIYSLRTDSWRSLECEVPALCCYTPSVFLNGNLHWSVCKNNHLREEGGYGSILLFDFTREVFDEMALPEEYLHVASVGLAVFVSVFNDLLAVFTICRDEVGDPELHSVCSVWVMREYSLPESWTKLYTFKASGPVSRFDGFTRNGELLTEMVNGERVSWNPITRQFTNLPISHQCDLVAVVESLVSL